MYAESLSTLISFVNKNSSHSLLHSFLYDEDDLYYIKHNIECINDIVSAAYRANKDIQSPEIAEAIQEVTSVWEGTK